jgi:hypothetical protein
MNNLSWTIRCGLAPCFVNYNKGCTRLAAASDKVYRLLAHGRWFSPGTPASSTKNKNKQKVKKTHNNLYFLRQKDLCNFHHVFECSMQTNTHRRMGHRFRFLLSPFLYYPPVFKIFIILSRIKWGPTAFLESIICINNFTETYMKATYIINCSFNSKSRYWKAKQFKSFRSMDTKGHTQDRWNRLRSSITQGS